VTSPEEFRSRRKILASIASWACLAGPIAATQTGVSAELAASYRLAPVPGSGVQKIRAAVEVKGDVQLDQDKSESPRLPLLVQATLVYDEKLLPTQEASGTRRSVRYYHQAEASIKIGNSSLGPSLRDDRRIVVVRANRDGCLLFSPLGPLTRDELELIDVQGNSLLWGCLLPRTAVAVGDSWEVERDAFGLLLGMDAVTQCDVRGTLTSVTDGVALVDLAGSVSGAVGGVESQVQIKAKCNFDLGRKQVTWFAASLREKRAISHAEPGFEVTARLRVAAGPLDESPSLSDRSLAGLSLEPDSGANLLAFDAERSNFSLIHDRRWRTIVDRPGLCLLRMVDRGTLIAQCNISELPDLESGKAFTLEAFQADVQRSLGPSFGQFVEAQQTTGENGVKVYRVVVSGSSSDVPIQWTYYHLADNAGRRASLAFTLEEKRLEQFAEADRVLVDSFQFTTRPERTKTEEVKAKPAKAEPLKAEREKPNPGRS
jgi:hypothetical protein